MIEKKFDRLKRISLFENIPLKDLQNLLKIVPIYDKKYKKDSYIILQEMPYEALFMIVEGHCTGEVIDENGKVLKMEDFYAPYVIAPALLFADDNRLPVSVVAREDVRVMILKRDDLLKIALKNEQLQKNLLREISNKFTFVYRKMYYLKFKTLKEKVLHYLSELTVDNSGFVTLPCTVEELANFFGVERPSLSRTLSDLVKEKAISREGKRIKVL